MHADKASVTAFRVAERRAAHQLCDTPKILDDPLALRIIGAEAAQALSARRHRERGRMHRGLRTFMAVRSRFAEDELAAAVGRGVRQYVVLGAGLDTSAYRHPHGAAGLRVFEVDHPATQQWKRTRLKAADIAVPPELAFVAVDFERQSLAGRLREAGFSTEQPTFISWLGVTPYLTREAFTGTLRFIASLPRGTTVVFDYATDPKAMGWLSHLVYWVIARHVAKAGEPFRTTFTPETLRAELQALTFSELADTGPAELNERYCRNRADGLRVGHFGRLMKALV